MSFWSKEVDWVSFFDTLVFIFHGGFITLRYFLKTPEFYFSFRDVRVHVRNLEEVLQTNTAFRNNINEVSLETDYTTFYEKKVIFGINNYFYYRLFFFLRYRIIFPFVYGILWLYFKLTLFDMQLLFSNKLFFLECLVVKYVNDFLSLNSRDLSIFRFFRSYVFNYIYLIFKLIQWHLAFWGLIFSFKTLKFYLNLLFSLLKSLFNFLIYSLFTFFTKFQFKHAYKYQFSVQYICFDLQKKKFYNFFSNELFFQNYIYLFYFFFLRKSVFYIKKLDKRIRLLRKYISLNKKLKNKLKPIFKKNFTSFFLIKKKIDYYKKKK